MGVAWSVASQSTDEIKRLLQDVAGGTPFVEPLRWMFEVANALLVLAGRRRILQLVLREIADVTEKQVLTIHDATCLELALRRGLPLASRDRALNKAIRRSGVRTLL